MSSRRLVIAAIAAGVVVGFALFAVALALVVTVGPALSAQMMALLVLGAALGLVLDATWLTLAVAQLGKLDHGRDDEDGEGGEGWGRPGSDTPRPRPPFDEPEWWPEFEHDFDAYVTAHRRGPIRA